MNNEYSIAKELSGSKDSEWSVYCSEQDNLSNQISHAKNQQEEYHKMSQELFQKSRDAYNFGDKSKAPYYSQQARSARDKREDWARELKRLISLSKNMQKPNNNVSWQSFNDAKKSYFDEKAKHSKIKAEYDRLKQIHHDNLRKIDTCKAEFDQAKKVVDDYRLAGQKESERIKTENKARWDKLEQIAKEAELRHIEKGRRLQYVDDGVEVQIRSGYDRRHHCITTDILVIDRSSNDGLRLHLVLDESGNELHRHTKNKHGRI
ncbi:MAG: hypothetical protein Q4A27_00750 [bacterium]|nr:hypothetical protein [bacterium]